MLSVRAYEWKCVELPLPVWLFVVQYGLAVWLNSVIYTCTIPRFFGTINRCYGIGTHLHWIDRDNCNSRLCNAIYLYLTTYEPDEWMTQLKMNKNRKQQRPCTLMRHAGLSVWIWVDDWKWRLCFFSLILHLHFLSIGSLYGRIEEKRKKKCLAMLESNTWHIWSMWLCVANFIMWTENTWSTDLK